MVLFPHVRETHPEYPEFHHEANAVNGAITGWFHWVFNFTVLLQTHLHPFYMCRNISREESVLGTHWHIPWERPAPAPRAGSFLLRQEGTAPSEMTPAHTGPKRRVKDVK